MKKNCKGAKRLLRRVPIFIIKFLIKIAVSDLLQDLDLF